MSETLKTQNIKICLENWGNYPQFVIYVGDEEVSRGDSLQEAIELFDKCFNISYEDM